MLYLRLGMFAILLSFATDSLAWACCNLTEVKECQPHWYAALGVGESVDYRAGSGVYITKFPSAGERVTFQPNYDASPIYFQGEVGYIWAHPFTSDLNNRFFPFMGLGIQYRHTKPVTLATNTLIGLPRILPYTIDQNSALLNWKIDFYRWFNRLMPYLNLGLGTSWNHISQTAPRIAIQGNPTILNTDSKTSTDWNYNIGVGLDFIVVTNFWLSLGYSYDTFGHLEIGKSFFTPDISGLNPIFNTTDIGNFHAHNIIFTARYLFG